MKYLMPPRGAFLVEHIDLRLLTVYITVHLCVPLCFIQCALIHVSSAVAEIHSADDLICK